MTFWIKATSIKSLMVFLGVAAAVVACVSVGMAASTDTSIQRFEHSGDGNIRLVSEKNGRVFAGIYRVGSNGYDPKALAKIDRLFDGRPADPSATMSLRLIEFLDYLQDRLNPGARIAIVSGYRAPEYNSHLRHQGRLAAKASLHQYGMAADIKLEGVDALTVWNYVKQLRFGGVGYYHGESVHIDVGPARSWDETTTGVGTTISDDNKLIGLISDYDRYLPGDALSLRFIRMTAFPIGVQPTFVLERSPSGDAPAAVQVARFEPVFAAKVDASCPQFSSIETMLGITTRLPDELASGTYRIRALFCERQWPVMPEEVVTPVFAVVTKR